MVLTLLENLEIPRDTVYRPTLPVSNLSEGSISVSTPARSACDPLATSTFSNAYRLSCFLPRWPRQTNHLNPHADQAFPRASTQCLSLGIYCEARAFSKVSTVAVEALDLIYWMVFLPLLRRYIPTRGWLSVCVGGNILWYAVFHHDLRRSVHTLW